MAASPWLGAGARCENQPSKDHLLPVGSAHNHLLLTPRGDIFEGQPAWPL